MERHCGWHFSVSTVGLVLGIVIWGNTVASANIVKNYIDAAKQHPDQRRRNWRQ